MVSEVKPYERAGIRRFIELGFASLGDTGTTNGIESEWRTYCLLKNIVRIQIKVEERKYKVEAYSGHFSFTKEQKKKIKEIADALFMEVEIYDHFARVQYLHKRKDARTFAEMLAKYFYFPMQNEKVN